MENMIDLNDDFYRYKMPIISLKHLHKKGGRTCIENIVELEKSLDRNKMLIIKYIGYKLNCQCEYDKSQGAIFNCIFTSIKPILNEFIEIFILCKQCRNPETSLILKKKSLKMICKSCGFSSDVANPKNSLLAYL